MQSVFAHLRRICSAFKNTNPPAVASGEGKVESERNSFLQSGHLRKSISLPKTNHSISSTNVAVVHGIHRLGGFDLQLNIFLTSSSVYRECGQIENALSAVEDAERMLLSFAKHQHSIRNQESRICRESETKAGFVTSSSGYWKESDPLLARFQADIALEVKL